MPSDTLITSAPIGVAVTPGVAAVQVCAALKRRRKPHSSVLLTSGQKVAAESEKELVRLRAEVQNVTSQLNGMRDALQAANARVQELEAAIAEAGKTGQVLQQVADKTATPGRGKGRQRLTEEDARKAAEEAKAAEAAAARLAAEQAKAAELAKSQQQQQTQTTNTDDETLPQ